MKTIVKLAWKNIWRNCRRTLITVSAVAFAVLFAVLMRSMRQGMMEQMTESIVQNNMGYLQIHNKGYWDEKILDNGFNADEISIPKLMAIDGILNIDKKIETGSLSSTGQVSRGTFVMSYDQTKAIPEKITNNITSGKFPESGKNQILMGEELAEFLSASIGDTIVFLGQGYQGSTAAGLYVLSGTVDMHVPELNRMLAYMTMDDIQDFISAPNLLTALLIDVEDPTKIIQLKKKIQAVVGDQYEVMTWQEMNPQLEQLIVTSDAEGWIMNFILYMIITFVMFGTILMSTQERKYELGVLQAIGMRREKAMVLVVLENVIINMIGAVVGVLIVAPIAYYFNSNPIIIKGEQAELFEKMGFEPVIPFSIDPSIAFNHAGIVLVLSILLLIYPILIIKNLKPIAAMKL